MHHKPRTEISHAQSKIDTTIEMEGECQPIDREVQVDRFFNMSSQYPCQAESFPVQDRILVILRIAILGASCAGHSPRVLIETVARPISAAVQVASREQEREISSTSLPQ